MTDASLTSERDEVADADAGAPTESVYMEAGRGGIVKKQLTPDAIRGNQHLEELFARVHSLLGDQGDAEAPFRPHVPETLEQMGLCEDDIQKLALKFLLQKGAALGREISHQIKVPFGIIFPFLKQWKDEQIVTYRSAGEMGDYVFGITDLGRERARKFNEECTYFGAAPVGLPEYLKAMEMQTIAGKEATEDDLKQAFSDLLISEDMFDRLGPAINSGRGMFLFGEPGNGKTSIAERITKCFGDSVWIPRALGIDGDIIRLFDPGVHDEIRAADHGGLFDLSGVDPRWVQVRRPTIIAGGELTICEWIGHSML